MILLPANLLPRHPPIYFRIICWLLVYCYPACLTVDNGIVLKLSQEKKLLLAIVF